MPIWMTSSKTEQPLFKNYIKSMFVIENKESCRFLTVDAYLEAVPFYEKNGFRFLTAEDDDPHTRVMYFDLLDLVA